MQVIGSLFGLTAKIITALIFLIVFALLARSGRLDDAAEVAVALFMIPVRIVGVFIQIVQAAIDGGLFGNG